MVLKFALLGNYIDSKCILIYRVDYFVREVHDIIILIYNTHLSLLE